MADAEYHRQWRAKRGARTGHPGPVPTQPCGTVAAFRRHKRAGEEPCAACKAAERDRQRALYAARRNRHDYS